MTTVTHDSAQDAIRSDPLLLTDYALRTITVLHSDLVSRLCTSGPVSIDRSGVQRVNTAVLQLLAAFVRDLRAASRPVEWCGENAAFDRAARALGLSASLGL